MIKVWQRVRRFVLEISFSKTFAPQKDNSKQQKSFFSKTFLLGQKDHLMMVTRAHLILPFGTPNKDIQWMEFQVVSSYH